jgi:hypothetical protein
LLIYGYLLKRKFKFHHHGITKASAVGLHLANMFYVMIPSLLIALIPYYIVFTPLAVLSFVGLIHGILETIALSLGV